MLNTHDKNLTRINLNKFTSWICLLFKGKTRSVLRVKNNKTWFVKKKKKIRSVLCKVKKRKRKKKWFYHEKSDMFWKVKKKKKKKRFLVYKKIKSVVGHKIKKTFERGFTSMR